MAENTGRNDHVIDVIFSNNRYTSTAAVDNVAELYEAHTVTISTYDVLQKTEMTLSLR